MLEANQIYFYCYKILLKSLIIVQYIHYNEMKITIKIHDCPFAIMKHSFLYISFVGLFKNLRICFIISILRILPKKFYGNEESCLLQQEEGATFQLYSYEFRILFSLSHIRFVELVSIYCFDFKSSTDCL